MQHHTGTEIYRERGDITQFQVDAIVNAANEVLAGGNGVDGAIHRAAGPKLLEACLQIGGCPTGKAVITPGFNLPAQHVIHTVGPVWRNGEYGEAESLASCYHSTLKLAETHRLRSIAFPAISCGAYGYPISAACEIAVRSVLTHLTEWSNSSIEHVYFVANDDAVFAAYETAMHHAHNTSR
ncbi:MAG: O-acetyl-ADP-ribose deacetylase, partial [Gammaproteobacteria bacterium]